MLLLALDTCTSAITVALHDGEAVLAERSEIDPRRHTELVSPLVVECLTESGVRAADITDVAVGIGPGPYTGLRVGMVTARTFGHALGVPVHGVVSLDALAHAAVRAGVSGEFLVATDARRKEVYWASYTTDPATSSSRLPWARLTDPAVTKPDGLLELLTGTPTGDAMSVDLPTVGRGPVLHPEVFTNPVEPLDVSASAIAEIALAHLAAGISVPVEAMYLRRPDAVPHARPKPAVPAGERH